MGIVSNRSNYLCLSSIPQVIRRLIDAPSPGITYFLRSLPVDLGLHVEPTPRPKNRNIVFALLVDRGAVNLV